MPIQQDMLECIGSTPLIPLQRVGKGESRGTVLLKLEGENPGHSMKDRLVYALVLSKEREAAISPEETTLVAASSGSFGVSLAMIGAVRGYNVVLFMPESSAIEARCVQRTYGAEVRLTRSDGLRGAMFAAEKYCLQHPSACLIDQNGRQESAATALSVGAEVWRQTDKQLGTLVAGLGSGSTLVGCRQFFASQEAEVRCVGVRQVHEDTQPILGLAASPVREVERVYDIESTECTFEDAQKMAWRLAREEGVLCGISSGAVVCAALVEAARAENEGRVIVAIISSYGERYLSTPLYKDLTERMANLETCSVEECTPPPDWKCAALGAHVSKEDLLMTHTTHSSHYSSRTSLSDTSVHAFAATSSMDVATAHRSHASASSSDHVTPARGIEDEDEEENVTAVSRAS